MASSRARYLSILADALNTSGQISSNNLLLPDTGVTAGSYGSASQVPVLTIDSKGRVTSASTTTVAGVTSFGYNTGSGRLTINTADGSAFTADVTLAPFSTTNLTEGTNQYFTTARARSSISASGSLSYNSTTGALTYTQDNTDTVPEGALNLYYTSARARGALSYTTGSAGYNSTSGQITIPGSSSDITEGTKLFYTDGRARAAISGGTGVSYNSTTGVVSIGQAVGTTDNVTFGNVTVNGTLTSDDITSTNITVSGNLTVSGTTTTVNSTTVSVADINIELARNATTAAQANGAGITVTGPTTAATITYSSSDDRWNLNKDLNVGRVYGNLTGAVTGNASTASALQTARSITITGDGSWTVNFDGSANVSNTLTLANSGVTAGSYGSGTAIPVITIDAKGRITSASTSAVTIGDGAMTVTAGAGLTGGGQLGTANQTGASSVTISHADTSSIANQTATTNTFISGITFDTYGHVQTITTGSPSGFLTTSGKAADSELLDGQDSTGFLRLLSSGAEASIDSYTDNGFRAVSYTGHSKHMLSWNAGGSTGTVQQEFHYNTPANGWRIRNKTDNSSWSSWGNVVMASSNQGLISGTIYHSGNPPPYPAEADTLATVTARGASTSTDLYLNGNNTYYGGANTYLRSNNQFSFLTVSGNAQYGRFNGIQVSDSYSGSIPANGILFYTDTTFSRVGAGSLQSSGDLRASIFYDSNDTTYYVDPASGSVLGPAVRIGTTSQYGSAALTIAGTTPIIALSAGGYGSSYLTTLGARAGAQAFLILGNNGQNEIRAGRTGVGGYLDIFTNNTVDQASESDGTRAVRFDSSGNLISYVSTRSPIFYDQNDTTYYVDPNSSSYISGLRITSSFDTASSDVYANMRVIRDGAFTDGMYIGYSNAGGGVTRLFGGGLSYGEFIKYGSYSYEPGSFRAPIFYDSDDTSYYLDPNNHTKVNTLGVGGSIVNSSTKLSVSGTSHFPDEIYTGGTAGSLNSWGARWWTTAGQMYWGSNGANFTNYGYGTQITTLNIASSGSVTAYADFRAPIFYDSADTTYYVDPNNTSTSAVFAGNISMNGVIVRRSAGTGYLSGNYSSSETTATTGAIYTIGGSYYPTSTSLNNIYGIGYTYAGVAGGTASATSSGAWGLYVASNGTTRVFLDSDYGRVIASGDMRAPIYYDRDDTAYYLDPNSFSRLNRLVVHQARVDSSRYPLGHYSSGETVFEIDPTWTNDQLQAFFNSANVSWVADSSAPGGYAIQIVGNQNVAGGAYGAGFPFIPVEQDDVFYMECWLKDVSGTNGHYMGSIDYNENFSSLGGNPGSYGYWVMSSSGPGTSWTKFSGYITGFGTSTGQFKAGTKYWSPQALFNYTGQGTSYLSGWKVTRVNQRGKKIIQATGLSGGVSTSYQLQIQNSTGASTAPDLTFGTDGYYGFIQTWNSKPLLVNNQGNYTQFGESIRAPIFYDSNDTGYYVDPHSASRLNYATFVNNNALYFSTTSTAELNHNSDSTPVAFALIKSGNSYADGDNYGVLNLRRTNHNNTASTAGASLFYELKDSGGTVREYAGITGRKTEAGAAGGQLDFHYYGRAVMANMNSSLFQHINSVRAPIFYDSNDTGYYCDPHSSSQFSAVYANNWFRPQGGVGVYWESYDTRIFSDTSSYLKIRSDNGLILYDRSANLKTYLYFDGGGFGLLDNSGNWNIRGNYGSGYAGGQFYGSWVISQGVNNGASSVPALNIQKGWTGLPQAIYDTVSIQSNDVTSIRMGESDGTTGGWSIGDSYTTFTSTHPMRFYTNGSSSAYIYNGMSGTLGLYLDNGSARSPIFYDWNDTGYYVDPNSVSYINKLNTYGSVSSTNNGLRMLNPAGATYITGTSTVSGAIKITLPSVTYPMLRMTIRVYTYDGLSFDIYCGGHQSGGTWYNTFAYMTTQNRSALNVRFTYGGGQMFIYIGDTGSSWSYPQVFLTDIQVGYSAYDYTYWDDGWVISFDSSTYNTVSATHTVYPPANSSSNGSSLYGSIFYDANNSGYYVDPAATASVNVAGTVRTSGYNSAGSAFSMNWPHSGWIDMWGASGQVMNINSASGLAVNLVVSGNVTAYSDVRFKTNIQKIENAIDKVKRINGITYDRVENPDLPRQTGVIAQEVLEVLPEAVLGSEDTQYSVAYGNMIGLLIEAIKEQDDKITRLEALVETLINKLGE